MMSSEVDSVVPRRSALRMALWQQMLVLSIVVRWCFQLLLLAWACLKTRVRWWWNPQLKRQCIEDMNKLAHMDITQLDVSDWQDTLFTWGFFKQEAKAKLLDFYQKVHLHGPAVNVDVITLDGTTTKLLDYSSDEERPLVVNFGSCT